MKLNMMIYTSSIKKMMIRFNQPEILPCQTKNCTDNHPISFAVFCGRQLNDIYTYSVQISNECAYGDNMPV